MSTQNVTARSTIAASQIAGGATTLTELTDDTIRRQLPIIIDGLATGVITLVGLVAAVTLIPAQTLSSTLNQQCVRQLAGNLCRWAASLGPVRAQ